MFFTSWFKPASCIFRSLLPLKIFALSTKSKAMRSTLYFPVLFSLLFFSVALSAQDVRVPPDSLREIIIRIDGKEFNVRVDVPEPPTPPKGLDSLARREYLEVVKGLQLMRAMRPPDRARRPGRRSAIVYEVQQAKLDSVLQALEATVKYFEKEKDTTQLNRIHQTIGEVHRKAGAPRFAIESFEEVQRMAEKRGDWIGMAEAKTNIGETHLKNHDFEKALFYLEDALKVYKQLEGKGGREDLEENYPHLYNSLGRAYQGLGRREEALSYYERAIEQGTLLGDEESVCYANTYIGSVYQEMHKWEEAKAHYQYACNGFEAAGHEAGKAEGNKHLGSLHLERGDYRRAEYYFQEALSAAELAQDKEQAMQSFLLLAKNARQRGDSDEAYRYYQQYEQYKDSLMEAERNLSMSILEKRYDAERASAEANRLEMERYQNQLDLNRMRNSRNIAFAGTGILLLLVFGIWQRSRYQREREQAVLEQERVRQLEHIDRLKDEFLANTSHELRTPLNGIIGLAESLADGAGGVLPGAVVNNLNMIAGSGRRLSSLVNDILDFSKLKNDELLLQRRPVDMRSATEVVLTLSEPLVEQKDVRLINEIAPDLPLVDADENRVQQILHNLVGNALKFTEQGSVRVWAEEEIEGWLAITVSDTGIGIPVDKQALIFQFFEQIDGSIAREYGGTGLGLTVTKQLVELHGGTIDVISEPGEGSHFTFTLPVSEVNAKGVSASPTVGKVLRNERTEPEKPVSAAAGAVHMAEKVLATKGEEEVRILIVDDEPVNLQVLQNHLSLAGYQVVKANNGFEALDILEREEDFDLIILDIMMPRMSGYEVCHKLRELCPPSELPIVMLTAKNRVSDLVEGFRAGANDYLTKPFSRDELLSRIKTHLRLNRIHRASGKFVPFEFLRSIGRETITDVQLGDQTEKVVTVYFSDIRDYTSMSESMTPAENFKFVNALNRRMGPIIRGRHGFVNQYLGDAIMAIFPEHPGDALQAAIDTQRELVDYNVSRSKRGRTPIRVGIGMHTGPLIMGIIGDDKRLDAATISDTVNTASRIENLTKFYGANILLSEDSLLGVASASGISISASGPPPHERDLADFPFHVRYLGKVQVKGKKEPIGLYECFDGDESSLVSHKLDTRLHFGRGMEQYMARDFSGAGQIFRNICDQNPEDLVARFFADRAEYYRLNQAPEGWMGVETMVVK